MKKHINKLALSSKRYYSFIESIVKETQAYFTNADDGYTIFCANYLNEVVDSVTGKAKYSQTSE